MKASTITSKSIRGVVLCIWLGVWQLSYHIVGQEVLIPSPFHTFQTLLKMMQQQSFYLHILYTLERVFLGIITSLGIGSITAIGSFYWKTLQIFLQPAITVMKATPVMAIIILALLWFRSGQVPIFVCFLMCYPIIYTNILSGLSHMDTSLIEMSQVYRVPFKTRMKSCYLPQLKTYLLAALDISMGIAFKVVIAAEVLSIPKYAIGYQLLDAKIYLETQEVFAWIVVMVLLSQFCISSLHRVISKE